MPHARRPTATLVIAAWIATACSGGGGSGGSPGGATSRPGSTPTAPPGPQANTVTATTSITFNPSVLTVPRGTTVTFTFESVGHNVFFDTQAGAPANIPEVLSNTSVARTFAAAGSFGYECHVHPGMRGTVVVQ